MFDAIDVVIPARNCALTLADVVRPFLKHPAIGRVIVVSNPPDLMQHAVLKEFDGDTNLCIVNAMCDGKGQAVKTGLDYVTTSHVVLCDADIIGLTEDHVGLMIGDAVLEEDSMVVGVCEPPNTLPERRLWSWPWVSGERCVPTRLLSPLRLHGYLMETQINLASHHANYPVRFERLKGCFSPYRMTEERIAAMEGDAEWGRRHGLL
jgi:glycosyltransferase involved in cell wall biosynthesis